MKTKLLRDEVKVYEEIIPAPNIAPNSEGEIDFTAPNFGIGEHVLTSVLCLKENKIGKYRADFVEVRYTYELFTQPKIFLRSNLQS